MGVFYIGILISAVLYGFCLLQAFIYFQSNLIFPICGLEMIYDITPEFARDPWFIRAAVSFSITTPGMRNHDFLQVISLVTFDTTHLIFVAMGGELWLMPARPTCLTVVRPQVYHYVITNYQCVASKDIHPVTDYLIVTRANFKTWLGKVFIFLLWNQ